MIKSADHFAVKYRPSLFKHFYGQRYAIDTIKSLLIDRSPVESVLLYGPRGCGKSSLARVLSAAILCDDRIELVEPCGKCKSCEDTFKASYLKNTGDVLLVEAGSLEHDDVWSVINFLKYDAFSFNSRVLILDNLERLNPNFFSTLYREVFQTGAENTIIFTSSGNLLSFPPRLLNSTIKIRMNRLRPGHVARYLRAIAQNEGAGSISQQILEPIVNDADGDLWFALSGLTVAIARHHADLKSDQPPVLQSQKI